MDDPQELGPVPLNGRVLGDRYAEDAQVRLRRPHGRINPHQPEIRHSESRRRRTGPRLSRVAKVDTKRFLLQSLTYSRLRPPPLIYALSQIS
ncbi:MAG: hypothetical protein R3B84_20735 [Zavarzinella sp.]